MHKPRLKFDIFLYQILSILIYITSTLTKFYKKLNKVKLLVAKNTLRKKIEIILVN